MGVDGCPGIDKRTNAEKLGLRLDYYLFDPKEDGVWVTATVNEMSEPLRLVENGSPCDVKQLDANLLLVIQAPGKAPLRIVRFSSMA